MKSVNIEDENLLVKYKRTNPKIFSVVIVFFLAIFLILGWAQLVDFYNKQLLSSMRENVSSELSHHANSFTSSINKRLALIEGLHSFVAMNTSPHRLEKEFELFASALYKSTLGIRNFASSPQGIQTYVYPIKLNKPTFGHNLLTDKRPSVQQGNKKLFSGQKTHIRGPINLRQGGQGLVITKAIFLNGDHKTGSFWGFTSMVIDMLPIYRESSLSSENKNIKISIKNDVWGIFIGDKDVFEKNSVVQDLNIGYEKWQIAGCPENGWNNAIVKSLTIFKVITGAIVLLLLVLCYVVILNRFSLEVIVNQRTTKLQQEITERKQAQQEIQKSNSLLSSIIESPDNIIMFALDTNYNYLGFNNSHVIEMKQVYGADIEIGQHIFSYMPREDDQIKAKINYKRVLKGERFIEIQKYGKADTRFWYEMIFNPIINISNQITGFTVFVTNITERKRTESELKQSTHDIGERIKELKCLYAISSLFENQNISMEKIFQDIVNFIPPSWQYPEITCAQIIFNDNQYKTDNFEPTNWKQYSNILIGGKHKGTVEVYYLKEMPPIDEGPFLKEERDLIDEIAERITRFIERKEAEGINKKLEAQLQQSQKMESIGTLAGGIAHDFNNILYPIIGFSEMSIEDLPENHPVRENLIDILQGANRARDLVKQILLFSRQKETEQKPLMLQPLIKETIKLLRSTIPSNIEIFQDLYEGSDYVLGDTTEFHEIIMNLCTNAYHAMEETGGILKISLKKIEPDSDLNLLPKPYCCLSVSDTGMGIPQNVINNIFEPYFTTKKLGKGTGLGLSVVHGIVENYKGKITIESESGKGTIFNVYFPITSTTKKINKKSFIQPVQGGDENILFVDDEKQIVKLGIRFLERLGYSVIGKTISIEALELFKSEPDKFDLVITDMAMPGMIGTQFAKKLMEIRSDIPIIICTGFSDRVDHETAKSLGIKGYIDKPILNNELSSKVRQVLDQSKKDKNDKDTNNRR